MISPIFSSCGEVKNTHPILQHPGRLRNIVKILQFYIGPIVVWPVFIRVAYFQGKGLDLLVLLVTKGEFVELAVMSIKLKDFIVDSGCDA